jgi:hypothetical protein
MAYQLWSQDVFSKGELSPFMYARVTVNEYLNGLKTAQNVLTYPTGAAGKRFGTLYDATLTGFTMPNQLFFMTFQYLNECVYQLIFTPLNIAIYLEGILIANVTTTLNDWQVYNISSTVLGAIFRVSGQGFAPYDLTRSNDSAVTITGSSGNTFTVASQPYSVGQVIPAIFTTNGTLPSTTPIITTGVTYFINIISSTSFSVYASSYNAKFNIDPFVINNTGSGTNQITTQNTWSWANTVFKNLPVYDFNGSVTSYDALTFTPGAVTGSGVTVTVSGGGYAPLNSSYVGGAFIGAGGTSRITAVASATSFTVAIQDPFDSTNAIQGSLVLLAEPAWSTLRGFPQIASSYQNRALFANTPSLPNGFWASVINDYSNFGDLTNDDDDAISWYPTSNNVNYIRFIVPYRSITVHTNTGIYSSPLSDIAAITPSNFTLQLQDSTPADVLQPQAIDNQVVVISGNDAHQMLWDGINNAYTSDIVSVISEQTIRNPVDETAFVDLTKAGSRYIFIINENGSMAIFQTLISQNVAGFTPQIMEQSYGNASFLQCASSADGRCWFVVQREIASALSGIAISGFTSTTLAATSSNFSTTVPTAITFTTTGTLPASTPQIAVETYYWAIGTDANDFMVYLSQEDALNAVNNVIFTSAGSTSDVVPWPLTTIYTLEELTTETFLDCAVYFNNNGTPIDTITTGALFNAQDVKMVGDGFGYDAIGVNNQVVFEAHGQDVAVNEGYIGFPINMIIEPMPLTLANGPSAKNTTLTKPKHVRSIRFMFNNTIGGSINGIPIALKPFDLAEVGEPPFPASGIFEISPFGGWDDFNNPTYTIFHDDPFNIQLLGVFYSVDI